MVIQLRIFGALRNYFGGERLSVELPPGATMRDLLCLIDQRWGRVLPAQLWDAQTRRFRGPVLMMTQEKDIYDLDMPLDDAQEVFLLVPLAGG